MTVSVGTGVSAGFPGKVPYILAQSAVPVCLAPNGTVATNGIVTLGTALPTTYSGGIWLRLPADAIVGGAAGLYWAVMSSTTAGQVYTNFADPASQFIPFIPSGTLVAAVGSNAAYTQTTGADVTLVNVTLIGGALGNTGCLRQHAVFENNNSAGTKLMKAFFGASASNSASRTTTTTQEHFHVISNRGSQSIQHVAQLSQGTPTVLNLAVNSSNNVALTSTGQLQTATDFIIVSGFAFEVLPS